MVLLLFFFDIFIYLFIPWILLLSYVYWIDSESSETLKDLEENSQRLKEHTIDTNEQIETDNPKDTNEKAAQCDQAKHQTFHPSEINEEENNNLRKKPEEDTESEEGEKTQENNNQASQNTDEKELAGIESKKERNEKAENINEIKEETKTTTAKEEEEEDEEYEEYEEEQNENNKEEVKKTK